MEIELSSSLNIELSPEILEELNAEQNKLADFFTEKRFYDSSPHLSLVNRFVTESDFPRYIEALQNEFKNDAKWELEFSDFRLAATGDYIFLHLSPESTKKMFEIHERALKATTDIGTEIPPGKFRHFSYDPHISIIKLEPENATKALSAIQKDMLGVKMPVTKYVLTKQTDDEKGFSNFPVVCEIGLK